MHRFRKPGNQSRNFSPAANQKSIFLSRCNSVWLECLLWVTKPTAAGGRKREAEEAQRNRAMRRIGTARQFRKPGNQSRNFSPAANQKSIFLSRCNSVWLECLLWVTKPTAAGGRKREAEEAQRNRAMRRIGTARQFRKPGNQSRNFSPAANQKSIFLSRCNSVWLECLLWEQDAAGSSPVTSTKKDGFLNRLFLMPKGSKPLKIGA